MKDANVLRTMENIMRMMPALVIAFLVMFGSKALLHSLNKPKKVPKPQKYKKKSSTIDDRKLNADLE